MRARLVLATLLGLALSHGVKGEDCKCGKEGQRDISMLMPYLSNGKVSQDKACELGMFCCSTSNKKHSELLVFIDFNFLFKLNMGDASGTPKTPATPS